MKLVLDLSTKMFEQADSHLHVSGLATVGRIISRGEQEAQLKLHRVRNTALPLPLHPHIANQRLNVYVVACVGPFSYPKTDMRWIIFKKYQSFPVDCRGGI